MRARQDSLSWTRGRIPLPPFSIPIGGIRLGNAYRRKLMKPKQKNGGCLALVRRLRWANQHGGERFALGA